MIILASFFSKKGESCIWIKLDNEEEDGIGFENNNVYAFSLDYVVVKPYI